MKVFGRPVRRYIASIPRAAQYARDAAVCARLFKSPGALLVAYVTRRRPRNGMLEMRSGMRIWLSNDPLDVVTVFGLFVRGDYGVVSEGSRVIDIGANIGVFSLYAIHCGASLVHAYEPSRDSFQCLQRNVEGNALGDRVKVFQVAVGSPPERVVAFPRKSSVLNAIGAANGGETDDVKLETLPTVLSRMPSPDLIKLDCEGEEENIIAGADAATMRQAHEVRLEYHNHRGDEVCALMKERKFDLTFRWAPDPKGGLAWFTRIPS